MDGCRCPARAVRPGKRGAGMAWESGWRGSAGSAWVSLGLASKVTAGCPVRAEQIEAIVGLGSSGAQKAAGTPALRPAMARIGWRRSRLEMVPKQPAAGTAFPSTVPAGHWLLCASAALPACLCVPLCIRARRCASVRMQVPLCTRASVSLHPCTCLRIVCPCASAPRIRVPAAVSAGRFGSASSPAWRGARHWGRLSAVAAAAG